MKHRRDRVCRGSLAKDQLRSLIAKDFGQRSWQPACCREKEKGRSQTAPHAFIHSGPGCLPGGHQFHIAVVGVMLMLVAFVRSVDLARFIAVVLVFVALVGVVKVSICFRFAHADYLPIQFQGPTLNSIVHQGRGGIKGRCPHRR